MEQKNKISLNIILLGIVSFLNDVSSEMIIPILPMFIASLGGTGLAIGLIGGLRESVTSLLKLFSGYLSDKTGKRKILVFSGYLSSSIFKVLLALSKTWHQVLGLVGLERIGKGLRDAPRDAIIAESMPGKKGKAFGIHRAFDTTGAILGSICAFILFWFLGLGFRTIIIISAALAFTSLIPLYFVKETQAEPKSTTLKLSLLHAPKKLKLFLLISGIFSLANISYMFFILQAQHMFGGKHSVGIPILLYILFNIFYAGFAIPFGKLSDAIGRKKVLFFGYSLFTLTCLGFTFLHSAVAYILLFASYGIVNAMVDANQRAFVSDLSADHAKGTSLGAYYMVTGLIALPASLIAGILWEFAPQTTFLYCAAISAIAASALVYTNNKL